MEQTNTTQDSGNTNLRLRARHFQLTLFDIENYEILRDYLMDKSSFRYLISCLEECPKTGRRHIHIYVNYHQPVVLYGSKTYNAHIERCRGSPKQNIDYIKKNDYILDEAGDVPQSNHNLTVGDLEDLENPRELAWNQYRTWLAIRQQARKMPKEEWLKEVEVIFITGQSGAGKSTKAYELADEEFDEVKYINGFWIGVTDGKGCCIYDDFRSSHMKASEFINFIDYRIHNLNTKGGNIKNKYNKIIVTSIQEPEFLYESVTEEQVNQWMRRIKVIDLDREYLEDLIKIDLANRK